MDFLAGEFDFNLLSLEDLLRARDAFHPHLMHKANVVGTAIGRYLIRKSDPYPPARVSETERRPPRTLENSEVREYSWPCVLVFVAQWAEKHEFGGSGPYSAVDFVPKTIYMPDGRKVPICVVEAPLVNTIPPPVDEPDLSAETDRRLSGGYSVSTTVQAVPHVASIGCLVTDGHSTFILTSRHVAGEPGGVVKASVGGREVVLGTVSKKQIGVLPFERLYEAWPGKHLVVNVDVGLIEVPDVNEWSASIYRIGQLGPLADLSIFNLSLNAIGCPVRASGGVSGLLEGRVAALFYRYKAVGGREYVADFLIGSRDDTPLGTHPGDSGSIWVIDSDDAPERNMPLAIQWGGAVFGNAYVRWPFALATNLSNVCRELNIEILRSSHLMQFEYWGAVGHYTIGSLACGQASDARLKTFLLANQDRISFAPSHINKTVNDVSVPGFVQLADVPDKVWKILKSPKAPYGRKGNENPNHYADIDLERNGQHSLDAQTPNAAALSPDTWRAYYHAVGFTTVSQRGLLPFRVWQIYKALEQFVRDKDMVSYITAAGVLAHYVGDACQPLHGSFYDDGDPFRHPDGTPSATMLPHGTAFAHGVHSAYEADMLDDHFDDLIQGVSNKLGSGSPGMSLVADGRHAGFATIELMRRTRASLKPKDIVDAYGALVDAGQRGTASTVLWQKFGTPTIACVADGCRTLAMLWESAWKNGQGDQVPDAALKKIAKTKLQKTYESADFLPSKALGQIDGQL
jgi:hypothetical protein